MGWAAVANRSVPVGDGVIAAVAARSRLIPVGLALTAPTLFLTTLAAEDVEQAHELFFRHFRLPVEVPLDPPDWHRAL